MIVIDFSQISALGMMEDPRFLWCFGDLARRLSDDSEIEATCIHEAAHVIYLEELGITTFQYHNPRVIYDAHERQCAIEMAAISADIPLITATTPMEKSALLILVSKYFAAGGAALLKLTAKKDPGDTKDFQDFQERLKILGPKKFNESPAFALHMWEKAKDTVTKEIEDEACGIKMRIQNKAKEIKPSLFRDVPRIALLSDDPRAFS